MPRAALGQSISIGTIQATQTYDDPFGDWVAFHAFPLDLDLSPNTIAFGGAVRVNATFERFARAFLSGTIGYVDIVGAIDKQTDGEMPRFKSGEVGVAVNFIRRVAESDTRIYVSSVSYFEGDVCFNSGDLLQDMGFHHAQFVDRIGDTFRWKSENVSTNEVAEAPNGFDHIDEANVHGVAIPHTDGRAAMAALVANRSLDEFDFAGLVEHLRAEPPNYAWPQSLRFRDQLEVTATLEQKKVGLRKEGIDWV